MQVATVNGQIQYDEDQVLYLPERRSGYISYKAKGVRFFIDEISHAAIAMYLFLPR